MSTLLIFAVFSTQGGIYYLSGEIHMMGSARLQYCWGFLLAGPIAGLVMHNMLQEIAYKITLGPAIILTGIGVTFMIAFVTVGFRSIKTALVNPVESLRSE